MEVELWVKPDEPQCGRVEDIAHRGAHTVEEVPIRPAGGVRPQVDLAAKVVVDLDMVAPWSPI